MIPVGTFTPFMVGLDTVKAEVIGLVRDGEQYMLYQQYETQNDHGKWVMIRRYFQRDRYTIEGLYRDSGGSF